jgi:hypothetical protein
MLARSEASTGYGVINDASVASTSYTPECG